MSGCGTLVVRYGILGIWLSGLLLFLSPCFAAQGTMASAEDTDQGNLEEIVVSAEKRLARIEEVPVSETVVNAESLTLAGVTTTNGLTAVIPGLTWDGVGAFSIPAIRGVSSSSLNLGNDNAVAVYVDGIYQASQVGVLLDMGDVEQVEVLRGPQGTLYGRNSTGGNILIKTRDPSLTETAADAYVSYGNFNDWIERGYVSTPIGSTLAVGLAVSHEQTPGYNTNIVNDADYGRLDSTLFRGKVLFEPTDSVKLLGSAFITNRVDLSSYAAQPIDGDTVVRTIDPSVVLPTAPYTVALPFSPQQEDHTRSAGGQLRGDFDLGFATVTSLTGYQETQTLILQVADSTPVDFEEIRFNDIDKNFSQEVDLTSKDSGPLRWVVGANFYHDDQTWENPPEEVIIEQELALANWGVVKTRAYAGFAQADYDFLNAFTLTTGLRYSRENKAAYAGMTAATAAGFLGDKTWVAWTPKVTLKYKVSDRSNLYATYSEGFKSGGYNVNTFENDPFNPEKLRAYEVGFKTEANSFRLNTEVFYYLYSDMQVTIVNGLTDSTQNAASSVLYGAEIEPEVSLSKNLTISGGLALLHATYRNYQNAIADIAIPAGGDETLTVNDTGKYLIRAPKWTLNLGANYKHPLPIGSLELVGSLFHSDGFFYDSNNLVRQPAYTLLGANVGWNVTPAVQLSLWGHNLLNDQYYQVVEEQAAGNSASFAPPRTYGVGVRLRL